MTFASRSRLVPMPLTTSGSATKSWIDLLRVERLVRVLEDELDPAPVVAQLAFGPQVALTSSPSKTIRPAVWRVSLTMTRPVVVLPLPDSPTSARTSPRRSVRSMPSTARTTPRRVAADRVEEPATDREVDLEARRAGAARRSRARSRPGPAAAGTADGRRAASAVWAATAFGGAVVTGGAVAARRDRGGRRRGRRRTSPRAARPPCRRPSRTSSAARTGSPAAGRAGPAASPG